MSLHTINGFHIFLQLFFCFLTQPALADLVINEFLPDPQGADAGQEFVELLNTGSGPINLEGLEFQFANGSVGAQWNTRWACEEEKWLEGGGRFLLVDRNWLGSQVFDAEAWLGLQNGPDAIRLFQGGEVLDLVGYGPLTDSELFEGAAVPMAIGLSLKRRPDGHDTDNNHLDFISGAPTPGEENFREYDVEVVSVVLDPPSAAEENENISIQVVLHNPGLEDLPPSQIILELQAPDGVNSQVFHTFFAGCSSGENCELMMVVVPPMVGRFSLFLEMAIPGEEEALRVQLGKIQVGCGAVFLTEVLAAPSFHQGEWIEIQAGPERVDLENYKIRDEEGGWRFLPGVILEPGDFLLVAQDSTALDSWHHENLMQGMLLDCPVHQLGLALRHLPGSWPSLNNSPPDDRNYADRVYLADEDGVVDHVTIPGDATTSGFQGISWERMSHDSHSFQWSRWRPSVALQGGTPGCRNSVAVEDPIVGVLNIMPPILDPRVGENVVHVRFLLDEDEVGWHVEIYDLWGKMIRDLGGGESGAGPGDLIWDGRTDQGHHASPGGYIVLLLKSREDGVFGPSARQLVVVR